MSSKFLAVVSSGLSDLFSGKLNILVATINGYIPSGVKYIGTTNSSAVTNLQGVNGGSLKPASGLGSLSWAGNEFLDNTLYKITQTGIINVTDQFGSDGNLDLRVYMANDAFSVTNTTNAVTFSDIFLVTAATNRRWKMETTITRRGGSIVATSHFQYTGNNSTVLEGAIFGGNSLNLDFTQPINLDVRAYPSAGTISLICQTFIIEKI